jgi:hypothetical protein
MLLLQQRDEGEEGVAAGLAPEQLVGGDVGGGDDDDGARRSRAWKRRPRMRASAMSLTWNSSKQQQRGFGGDSVGQRRDRVGAVRVGALPGVDAGVGVLHEAVEVDALLAAPDVGRRRRRGP